MTFEVCIYLSVSLISYHRVGIYNRTEASEACRADANDSYHCHLVERHPPCLADG
jgi:hypothetical protein